MLRALPAGLLLLALTRTLPQGIWWLRVFVLGALNFSIFWAMLFVSAYRLPGGVAATVGAVQPLVVVLLSSLMLGARLRLPSVVAALAWLGLIGAALTYVLWFRGLARLDTRVASSLGFLSPVMAVLLGWVFLGQSLGWLQFAGAALVLASIRLGQRAAGRDSGLAATAKTRQA